MSPAPERDIAVVTGGTAGIGRAIAAGLAAGGADIAIVDITAANLEPLKQAAKPGQRFMAWQCDATSSSAVTTTCKEITVKLGAPTILVNNVGGSGNTAIEHIEDMTDEVWDRVMALNLGSVMRFCRALVPAMKAQSYGRIVNVTSSTKDGMFGPAGTVGARLPYVTSKSGIVGLTRQLAMDLGAFNITVNAISPGLTLAGEDARIAQRFRALPPEEQKHFTARIPAGRLGSGEDMANAVRFLASRESSYITGEVLKIAGGA